MEVNYVDTTGSGLCTMAKCCACNFAYSGSTTRKSAT